MQIVPRTRLFRDTSNRSIGLESICVAGQDEEEGAPDWRLGTPEIGPDFFRERASSEVNKTKKSKDECRESRGW